MTRKFQLFLANVQQTLLAAWYGAKAAWRNRSR